MSVVRGVLIRTFGRPKGVLGRLGGIVMARTNQTCAAWVIDLLAIQRNDKVLEVGFGPGARGAGVRARHGANPARTVRCRRASLPSRRSLTNSPEIVSPGVQLAAAMIL